MPPDTCLELRIFRANYEKSGFITPHDRYASTYAGWYDNPETLIADASRCRGISAFVTLNPVNPALLGRVAHKLVKCKNATTDDDIVCLRWLYLDIDPARPADISSTDTELSLAVERRDRILLDNPEMAKSSLWGKSGNGAFIFVRLPDYPNDTEHRSLVAGIVNLFSLRYSDERVKVDPTTKNPARVTCLPGTWKCKGSSLKDRPWRLSTIDRTDA
jgi:hypothetical protein